MRPISSKSEAGARLLRVRGRSVQDVEAWTEWTVDCPRRGRIGLEVCATCSMCSGIVAQEGRSPALVACQFRPTAERARTLRLVRSLPSAADSDYTPVSALLSGECTCLAADLSATLVTTLFLREDLDCAAVVDSSGRAIGTLSSREILRHHWQGAEPQRTVKDIMHPLAVRLTESTSADVALALMQRLRLPQALVVSQAGQPLGLLSVLDLASWLTRVPSQRAPAATT